MATMLDLAKEAFNARNFFLACEIFEGCLSAKDNSKPAYNSKIDSATGCNLDVYYGYGDSLARMGRLKEAFDCYAHIIDYLCGTLAPDRLKHLAYGLIESVLAPRTNTNTNTNSSGSHCTTNSTVADCSLSFSADIVPAVDPLCCPICEDILKYPVTAVCGHTFCRQCCFGRSQCTLCGQLFPSTHHATLMTPAATVASSSLVAQPAFGCMEAAFTDCGGFEQDVLVKRLVERWWGPELVASELNEEAQGFLERNALDDALRCCNQSLEKAPNSFNGLLLRSQVLYRLSHYQSSLADADNALKSRPTSYKVHYGRALALAGLGRIEEALIAHCVSLYLDKTSQIISSVIRNDILRLLQRIIISSVRPILHPSRLSTPYNLSMVRRKRHRQRLYSMQSSTLNVSDYDENNSSCGEDDAFSRSHRKSGRRLSGGCHVDGLGVIIPRQNVRLRSLVDRIQQEIEKIRRVEARPIQLQVNPTLIEPSDFDCVLCCRTLWKPVVTPCGHTYCWVCLDRCLDYSSACPLCKAPLIEQFRSHYNPMVIVSPTLISLSRRHVTKFIEAAMQRFIPSAYNKRQRQELDKEPSVPVFICTTAFPGVPCPLHIYEPRYKLMVRRAIESGDRKFGIALAEPGRQRYVEFGTMLDIRDCLVLSDGSSFLSTVGMRRFRVLARGETDGYDTANVEFIKDEPIDESKLQSIRELHQQVWRKAKEWHDNLPTYKKVDILKSFGKMPDLEEHWELVIDGPAWAWWIIAILPLHAQLKIGILGTTNLEKRLRAIDKTLNLQKASQQCVVAPCEGVPSCQAIDCCQNQRSSTNQSAQLTTRQTTNEPSEYLM